VAIDLLQIMVLYRDILFSDIEFILTKQELQISQRLTDEARVKAWPLELEPAALSDEEDDRFSSGGDVSSSSSGDENQALHDDATGGMAWGRDSALEFRAKYARRRGAARRRVLLRRGRRRRVVDPVANSLRLSP
jgi:hypothetical protein